MTKAIPQIEKYMTSVPHSIGIDQTIRQADKLMRQYHIRHLPVLDGGKPVGIISDRDLKLYMSFLEAESEEATIAELVQEDLYTVSPSATLSEVVATMAERRIGSAVIIDNGKLVGIFTEVDAMKAFSDLLESRLKA